ncbi:hypothetical protein GALMADRAFT_1039250 [Galerina marginata CBS 339.88]|uniref:Zinc finger PHD-type domain-containing protein n=1 Tax=Galerina marginata (strain CBS 339.88) TaxID=685588 RepID=A0A067SEA7_GALM3|nr:hypothetical protein GALMADRAFT_1039250 [Galerina marginata CBS 339.88]
MKVYEGSHAEERCLEAAKFIVDRKVMHSNIPHLIAVSSLKSKIPFLIFDGEYEGTVDHILGQVLKQDLKQSLVLGIQTVIGLSSGLDYLQDLNYPFALAELDDFSLFSCKGKVIISFDPEGLGERESLLNDESIDEDSDDEYINEDSELSPPGLPGYWALEVFHALCQKTFDAACKSHYDAQGVHRIFDDDLDDSVPEEESEDLDMLNSFTPAPFLKSTEPGRSPRKTLPSGHRRELVWKPPIALTDTLDDISRQFQYFLRSHSDYPLIRRHGKHTARAAHRCPGYNREEITLTTDTTRSAIVVHSRPNPHEICLVCKQVVEDTAIFACICGGNSDDAEYGPSVQCTRCYKWHHMSCAGTSLFDRHIFECDECQMP